MRDALLGQALPFSGRKIDNIGWTARALHAADSAAQCRADRVLGWRQQQQRAEDVREKAGKHQKESAEHGKEAAGVDLDPADRSLAERGAHALHVAPSGIAD